MVHVSTAFETGAVGCECILQPQYKEDEMSSKIIKPYFGPTDFRMMREILRRAGYRLYDTAENRAAHISAARLLIQEFQSVRSPSRAMSQLSRQYARENVEVSPAVI